MSARAMTPPRSHGRRLPHRVRVRLLSAPASGLAMSAPSSPRGASARAGGHLTPAPPAPARALLVERDRDPHARRGVGCGPCTHPLDSEADRIEDGIEARPLLPRVVLQ